MATGSVDLGLRGLRDVEVIGSGGSAVVYRAVRDVPGRFAMEETVAVKVLRSSWDSRARRRFEREQRVMDRLSDTAGFVPILETGETVDGSPYIIMPFYEGGSLQARVARSGPIEWPRAVRLVEEVARTLQQAHELDVFHRDIKPANILLTESGRPHVADFGISLIAEDTVAKATSTAAFTPAYSPPESFTEGLLPVATTDIYGLAATLWAILAGHAPFKEPGEQPTAATVFGRVAMHQVGDLREHVPSPICRFIERAMAKLPEERPATMSEFVAELEEAREDAYRGVEVARLEVTPLVDVLPVEATDGSWTMSDAGTLRPGAEGDDAGTLRPGAEGDDAGTLRPGAEGDDAGTLRPGAEGDDVVSDEGDVRDTADRDDSIVMLGVLTDEIVATAEGDFDLDEPRVFGGWTVKVTVAAVSTVLLLLLVWWLVAGGNGTEESAGHRLGNVGDAGVVALGD